MGKPAFLPFGNLIAKISGNRNVGEIEGIRLYRQIQGSSDLTPFTSYRRDVLIFLDSAAYAY